VRTTPQVGGDAAKAPAVDATTARPLEIIDFDEPNLSDNDRDIFEAVLERMLGEPEALGVEASESATPEAATIGGAAEPVDKEPTSDAVVVEQLAPSLVGATGGPEASATPEAARQVLGDPVTSTKLTPAASLSPTAVVGTTTASVPKPSSPRPAALPTRWCPSQVRFS
jgi:hypothetical protein